MIRKLMFTLTFLLTISGGGGFRILDGIVSARKSFAAMDSVGITHNIYYTFDGLPVTTSLDLPGSSENLTYGTTFGSKQNLEGWRSNITYGNGIYDFFYKYLNEYNSANMGYETYGYFEIDNIRRVSGNSLKFNITGGKNASTLPAASGLPLQNKAAYLGYIAAGKNPVGGPIAVGNPYIYIANSSLSDSPTNFAASQGATALTLWMWIPETWNVGPGGYDKPPYNTLTFGPYSQVKNSEIFPVGHIYYNENRNIGNHFYHDYPISGGGWVKIYIDSHPRHNNSWNTYERYPYPSYSLRSIGTTYFNNMYRLYFAGRNYEGNTVPPFSVWFDELDFINDPEPQNNETINSPAVMYNSVKNTFEVGFTDKYVNQCNNNFPNYELRYSFAPITNSNWTHATPAHILSRAGFNNTDNLMGRIVKNSRCYAMVWAEFRLTDADQANISTGTKIYFAIKDISQSGGNGQLPVVDGKGRNYTINPALWDYAGDQAALLLIKRFDYTIIEKPPNKVKNLINIK